VGPTEHPQYPNTASFAMESEYRLLLFCKEEPGNPGHWYQIHNRTPYQVRCSSEGCSSKLQRSALIYWIAALVQSGVVSEAGQGMVLSDELRVNSSGGGPW
jgi:hypothetical protein